jgi:peptidoglycan/xylan/chitin deacetylase (PgdA/CDA1 family)/SAM-dependent methyltransferase
MGTQDSISSEPSMRSVNYWETLFSEKDPWKYSTSAYERWKTGLVLELLPPERPHFALEVGCAEGHMSVALAQRVERLLAVDISATALTRARERCTGCANVEFRQLDIVDGALPAKLDLILVSEVLFYISREEVEQVAQRFTRQLEVGGHVLLVHGNVIQDDRTRTGFDWGHEFGALTIGRIFGATKGLALIRELRTPLFTIQLFRRLGRTSKSRPAAQIEEIPLPLDLELLPELERTILWDGAAMTREEAQRTESASSVPILMYHSIADDGPMELAPYRTSPADFRAHLRYLRAQGYHSISLQDWVESIAAGLPVPGRPVIITFDDAYQDFFDSALPALERSGFTATVFVVTEKAGAYADWDQLADPPRLMGWNDIRAAVARDITIGSHSANHKDLARIPRAELRREAERSRATLEEQLGETVEVIAYPWGRSDPESRKVLADCGYRIGLRSWGGKSTLRDDPLELSRIEINGTDDLETVIRKIKGEYVPPDEPESEQSAMTEMKTSEPVSFFGPQANGELISFDPQRSQPKTGAGAEAELVEFAPAAPQAHRPEEFSPAVDFRQQIASRLDALVGEFVKLQVKLLNDPGAPMSAQRRLASLFALPVTGRVSRKLEPSQEIVEGVIVSFEETANLNLLVEPKLDHSLSPEGYLNTLRFELTGRTEWLSMAVALDWRELSLARRFQLSFYGNSNRAVTCEAALRLPRVGNPSEEIFFSSFTLSSQARNAVSSGELSLPDFIKFDTRQPPELVFYFDISDELSLEMNYLNCYFA